MAQEKEEEHKLTKIEFRKIFFLNIKKHISVKKYSSALIPRSFILHFKTSYFTYGLHYVVKKVVSDFEKFHV